MARWRTRSWQSVRAEKPLDPEAVAWWDWVSEAKDLVAAAGELHGAGDAGVAAAHRRAELTWDESSDTLRAGAIRELQAFAEALGGRLEPALPPGGALTVHLPGGEMTLPPPPEGEARHDG